MKPLEAYRIISQCMDELFLFRREYWRGDHAIKGYSKDEISAQVMAFEALRRMEEEQERTES